MSNSLTNGIRIQVKPEYIPARSDPTKPMYFYAYHITITNELSKPAKLMSRYWHITDANGSVEEVRGPGVVGKKPRLEKGESFSYTSFCPLATEFGVMQGTFQMVSDNGEMFDARVEPFKLAVPFSMN